MIDSKAIKSTTVVILAAGSGTRLKPLTSKNPKPLLKFCDEELLKRNLRILSSAGFNEFKIVVGYMSNVIKSSIINLDLNIQLIENKNFENDKNLLSLFLGIQEINEQCLILEGDVVFSEDIMNKLLIGISMNKSIWFTSGNFTSSQVGGIIKSDKHKRIVDMKIVKSYDDKYRNYSKNLGLVFLNKKQLLLFKDFLRRSILDAVNLYYMDIWIKNLNSLEAYEVNLAPCMAASFNTIDEYELCMIALKKSL